MTGTERKLPELRRKRCWFGRHRWLYGDLVIEWLHVYQRQACERCGIVKQREVGRSTTPEYLEAWARSDARRKAMHR